jgi:aryl-alcohol dehydrogenase-like predicted oxidoreductase
LASFIISSSNFLPVAFAHSVTTVLPNFTKEEEITEWAKATGKKLDDEIIKEAKRVYYERLHPYVVMRSS